VSDSVEAAFQTIRAADSTIGRGDDAPCRINCEVCLMAGVALPECNALEVLRANITALTAVKDEAQLHIDCTHTKAITECRELSCYPLCKAIEAAEKVMQSE